MTRKFLTLLLLLAALPLVLSACLGDEDEEGDADADVDTDVDADTDADTDADGDFAVLELDAGSGSGSVTILDAAAGTETVVVLPYSLATTGGASTADLSASVDPRESPPPPAPAPLPDADADPDLRPLRQHIAFDQYLRARVRAWLADLPDRTVLRPGPPQPPPAVGETRDFGFETGATISAEVVAASDTTVLWVDQDDLAGVSAGDLDALFQSFDTISGPRDKTLYSYDAAAADKDGDGAVALLMTSKVNDVGEGFTGFFNAKDFDSKADNPNSNEMDLLYISVPGGDLTVEAIQATMVHEFEHLINFSNKVVKHGNALPEETWLDEGLAHLAEDLGGYGQDVINPVALFLESFGEISLTLTNYDDSSDTVENRGAGYLFILYLVEQAGGITFAGAGDVSGGGVSVLQSLAGGSASGIAAVEAATGRDFADVFTDWLAALALDGTGVTGDARYNYQAPTTDPVTGGPHGMDLRGGRENSSGTTIDLDGPDLGDFDETPLEVEMVAGGALNLEYLPPAGETIEISLSGDGSAALGAVVFVK